MGCLPAKSCKSMIEMLEKSCKSMVEMLEKSCKSMVEMLEKSCKSLVNAGNKSHHLTTSPSHHHPITPSLQFQQNRRQWRRRQLP